jgi:hypothetical protein
MTQERLFTVRQEEYTSDDYWTPKWIFDALGLEFDLDVACPPEGPTTPLAKRSTVKKQTDFSKTGLGRYS